MTNIYNLPKVTSWLSAQKNESMKKQLTNADHLRALIIDNAEAVEFLDAIEEEIQDLNGELKEAQINATEWEEKHDAIEEELDAMPLLSEVDCGIGVIKYQCDNLALSSKLEDFLSTLRSEHVGSSVLY